MRTIAIIFLSAFIFTQCNTSKITNTWRAPFLPQKEYRKILVVGFINEKDRSIRAKMENHLIDDLKNLGYIAISSLKEYGPTAFEDMNEKTAIKKMENSGVDAILTIVLVNSSRESKYIPAHTLNTTSANLSNRFWDYQTSITNRIYEPGHYITKTRFLWESNLYDAATQNLVYSAQTKTLDPLNAESMGHEYGRMIVNDMVKKKILNNYTAGKFD